MISKYATEMLADTYARGGCGGHKPEGRGN